MQEKVKDGEKGKDVAVESSKVLKAMVKPRPRVIENISVRYTEKVTKILKSNLSNIKYKEFMSRITHEFCRDSSVNLHIKNFHEFVLLVNERVDNREDVSLILEACKRLNYKPNKTLFLPYYNSNEFIDEVKAKALEHLLTLINDLNEYTISSDLDENDAEKYARNNGFKAFIEKGNHGTLVKTVLNRRSWWSIQDSHDENYESSDFIWTQWLKQPILDNLP